MYFYLGGGVLLLIAIIGFFVLGSAKRKRERMLGTETYSAAEITAVYEDTKAEMIGGPFIMPCELKGRIDTPSPLTAPFSRKKGIWVHSLTERQRQYVDWVTNPNTKKRRKILRQVWETVSDETNSVDFYVKDESGRIRVSPQGAELIGKIEVFDNYEQEPGRGEERILGHRRREWIIPTGVPVYVLGVVSDVAGDLIMRRSGDDEKEFIISLKSERELVKQLGSTVQGWRVAVPVCGVLGAGLIVIGILT